MNKPHPLRCPMCNSSEFWMSKNSMRIKILEKIGYKGEKSPYSDGNFSKVELFEVYKFLKEK